MSRHRLGTGPQTRVRCPHCGTESCPAHRPAPHSRTTHRQLRARARGNLPSVGRTTWASSWQSLCCRYYGSRYLVDWIFLIEHVKKSVWTLILINAAELTIRKFFSYLYECFTAVNVGIHVSNHQNSEPIPGHHAPWHLTSDIWHIILTIAWTWTWTCWCLCRQVLRMSDFLIRVPSHRRLMKSPSINHFLSCCLHHYTVDVDTELLLLETVRK